MPPGTFGCTFDAYLALIHPDDREEVQRAVGRSIESGADYEAEFRSLEPEGSVRWMMGKGKVLTDEQGRAVADDRRLHGHHPAQARRRGDPGGRSPQGRVPGDDLARAAQPAGRDHRTRPRCSSACPDDAVASSNARVVIRRQTEQLTRIVDDLLDVSRLSAGKLRLERRALDLAALVDRCLKELAARRLLDHHRHEAASVPRAGPRRRRTAWSRW